MSTNCVGFGRWFRWLLQLYDGEITVLGEIKLRLTFNFLLMTSGQNVHDHKVGAGYLQQVQNLQRQK